MNGRSLIASLSVFAAWFPSAAFAQAYSCALPATLPRVHPDSPSAEQPQRILPIGGYTLAISWSPQYCRGHTRDGSSRFQCGLGNRFGFTLHGLWPDGVGKDWPQYCRSTELLPAPVILSGLCATPSAQLLQHEWAKHGTCMARTTPADFFRQSNAMYRNLRFPDMDALSRRPLNAGRFAAAMARVNPGLSANMMRITAARGEWLEEVWICLDKGFRYTRCPMHQGGLSPRAALRIWHGTQ